MLFRKANVPVKSSHLKRRTWVYNSDIIQSTWTLQGFCDLFKVFPQNGCQEKGDVTEDMKDHTEQQSKCPFYFPNGQ